MLGRKMSLSILLGH